MSSTALAVQEAGELSYSSDQIQLIKDTYAKGATDQEFSLFIEIAKRKGLDIFSRQIHLVSRWDSKLGREVREPQTGIDGYRLIAERTGKYEGQIGPLWCGTDGQWVDVWLSDKPPAAAKVGVLKTGCREPFWGIALYREYAQTTKAGSPTYMWAKMPGNQLAKCAEALSLRKAFPAELAGIYTQEEMGQATIPAEPKGDVDYVEAAPVTVDLSGGLGQFTTPEESSVYNFLLNYSIEKKGQQKGEAYFKEICASKTPDELRAAAVKLGWQPPVATPDELIQAIEREVSLAGISQPDAEAIYAEHGAGVVDLTEIEPEALAKILADVQAARARLAEKAAKKAA